MGKNTSPRRGKGTVRSVLFFKGILLGISTVLPGISGGTLAFLLGIYKQLIGEISKFHAWDLRSFKALSRKYDWPFLGPLLIGALFSLILFVFTAPPLIQAFQLEFYSLVFGFVLASLYSPFREMDKNLKTLIFSALSGSLSFVFFYLAEIQSLPREGAVFLWMFPAGIVVAAALLIPGLSGSYLLVLMGLYHDTLRALRDFDLPALSLFVTGALTGIFLTARRMKFLLDRFFSETLSISTGLILGSLWALRPFPGEGGFFSSVPWEGVAFLIWFSLSFSLTLFLSLFYGKTRDGLLK